MNDILLISFAILLPLTPALYKGPSSQHESWWSIQGLNIQLWGAFAGYFL